jgi:hypothetical protein
MLIGFILVLDRMLEIFWFILCLSILTYMMNIIRKMMKYLPLHIAPTLDVQHFFVKYLFILENEVRPFQT